MRIIIILVFLAAFLTGRSQGFEFESNKSKAVIPFKLINNLIFVPIEVNGVELNFLLDSGVEETILFSLDDQDEVSFNDVEKIELRGLGSAESVNGLKSANNHLSFFGFHDRDHDIYIILDQDFNFSSHIGIPVNGIIGYHFFKNYLVEINYDRKKIIVYRDKERQLTKIKRKFSAVPMTVEKSKPYIEAQVLQDSLKKVKLLVDTGSSDALWLFSDASGLAVPALHFDDYLGRGFSGDIFGKRARIDQLRVGESVFNRPIIAFPDTLSIKNLNMVAGRSGSVGGEILRRHRVVFDYQGHMMYLRKGKHYNAVFNYNMSGIELQHGGLQWIQETVPMQTVVTESSYDISGEKVSNFIYKFNLKPVYTIAGVRSDSPADVVGLRKGDLLLSVNGKKAYKYTLQQLNALLKSEDGQLINIDVERANKVLQFEFRLKSLL